ncbi:zinc-binding dehydrogenase [Petralouisia muris]|uniref:zinc-binding dehydrogenase n=1 Tax=Petralouisia muris TaxID=3032872 RepID=UPI0023B8658C|nr:zinc-binding dehydrogenase [Petralouisia muris]
MNNLNTKAVRIYGVRDLRLEEFELPAMGDDEIQARIITDSLCMSTYKVANQGAKHKKLPDNLAEHPVIMGHEFCGVIEAVGKKWQHIYQPGDKFVAQPNLGRADTFSLGYSFPYVGGEATRVIIMNEAIEKGCLLPYQGDSFFEGALVEPLSCVIAGFKANFHLRDKNDYDHAMGVKERGAMAILGGTGPMGSLAIDYAVHGEKKPALLVVTGSTEFKLERSRSLYPPEEARKHGVELHYVHTPKGSDFAEELQKLTPGQKGFDDIFLMVAQEDMVTKAEALLAGDGCLNFFAGPTDSSFSARMNFYNLHYNATHFVGTSGSNTQDMKDAIACIEKKTVNLAKIATHIMGLNDVCASILKIPELPGGKKIVYSQKHYPVTDVQAFLGQDSMEAALKELVAKHDGLWSAEAEAYFLENCPDI